MMTSPYFLTPVLLLFSNVLMTFAWYGHLKQPAWPLWLAVLLSWGIAFFEYCFAVPANRIGYGTFTGQQLKVMQEVITLAVFAVFSVMFLGEQLRWNYFAAMGCLVAAVIFIFLPVD
ncbi:MAG: DMT family protein [Falsiroseomonas sp.]|nr:DMT family protein [Falsiroseomonas sp.]